MDEQEAVEFLLGSLGVLRAQYQVWPAEVEACIHNEPVAYAIDAIYAAATGTVVAVERELPAGDATVRCHEGVQRVLEVRARVAARVEPGDELVVQARP